MKHFAELISALESTNKTNAKVDAMVHYLRTAPDSDKLWFLALFTGKRPKRPVNTNYLKQWALEIIQLPEWLFLESYSSVGDLGETLSLILPPPENDIQKTLSQWMDELLQLKDKTDDEKKIYVTESWNGLDYTERFIFNKLIGGSFRIGVSKKLLITALSKYSEIDSSQLMHSIMGKWSVGDINFEDLITGTNINPDNSKPYPFCLAYPLEKETEDLGSPEDWQAEYKWDGIRGQLIKRNEELKPKIFKEFKTSKELDLYRNKNLDIFEEYNTNQTEIENLKYELLSPEEKEKYDMEKLEKEKYYQYFLIPIY